MKRLAILALLAAAAAGAYVLAQDKGKDAAARKFTDSFLVDDKDFASTGRNPYFILEPGYALVLESADKEETLTITVLDETKKVGNVETRVVEERETEGGKVKEVSRNYFAIDKSTNSVYYFGEDTGGAWLHGEKGAHYGLMMPGIALVGARHYQEMAPGVALDRAEILGVDGTMETPAGKFDHVLEVEETSGLKANERELKHYAPGVGLLNDEDLKLVKYGMKK